MEISDLIRVILRRKWVIMVTAAAAVIAAYGVSTMQPRTYRAYAIVRVMTAIVGDSNWVDYNILYTDRLINTYTTLLGTAPVTTEIMARLGFDTMPEITIETLPNTELLQITAADENPEHAAAAANAVADIFVTQDVNVFNTDLGGAQQSLRDEQAAQQTALDGLQQNLATLLAAAEQDTEAIGNVNQQIEAVQLELDRISQELASLQLLADSRQGDIVLVEQATIPTEPDSNSTILFLALGLMGGGVAGVGLALLLHTLDERVYSAQEIESVINQPIIARIPQLTNDIPALFESSTPDLAREEIRRLCILLQQQLSLTEIEDQPGIVIMVTAYPDSNDKALLATGLAYAMAETRIKTLLVEGDLVNPSIIAPQTKSRSEDAVPEDETISAISVRWRSPYIDLSIMPGVEPVINDQYLPQFYLRLQKEIELARRSYTLVLVSMPSPLASVHSARLVALADVTLVITQRGVSRQPLLELVNELRRFESTKLEFIESNANIANRIREYHAYWSPKDSVEKARRSINAFWTEKEFQSQPVEAVVASSTVEQSVSPSVTPPASPPEASSAEVAVETMGSDERNFPVEPVATPVDETPAGETPAESPVDAEDTSVIDETAGVARKPVNGVQPVVQFEAAEEAAQAAPVSYDTAAAKSAEPVYELPLLDVSPDEIPTSEVMVEDIRIESDDEIVPDSDGDADKTAPSRSALAAGDAKAKRDTIADKGSGPHAANGTNGTTNSTPGTKSTDAAISSNDKPKTFSRALMRKSTRKTSKKFISKS
jgi:capsular polysaccharide biosynthesis protein